MTYQVREYINEAGKSPFRKWFKKLGKATQAKIQVKVFRFEQGNLGDHKALGDGVWEARINVGSGYRLYFGKAGKQILLLLLGGDKSTQRADVKKAKEFWMNYKEHDDAKKK